MNEFKSIDPKALPGNIFSMLDDGWALATAGTREKFNTMTISWGGLGWLWGKPVCFTFVRPERYTYQFIEEQDCYTVSFFSGESYRQQLKTLGTRSGRDMDKMGASGLTPVWIEDQPAFLEADVVLVCKKLYQNKFEGDRVPAEALDRCYPNVDREKLHVAYTSEVLSCWVK